MSGLFVLSTSTASAVTLVQEAAAEKGFTQVLKEQFIQGGASFMGIVLLCLILGLAVAIERIIFLNLATTNTTKLKEAVEEALKSGGVNAAKELCRDTKGPVASIFYQGLDRAGESVESAEKAVVAKKKISSKKAMSAIDPALTSGGAPLFGILQLFI